MYATNDFNFGFAPTGGASNPTGVAMQNMASTGNMSATSGGGMGGFQQVNAGVAPMGGITAGANLGGGNANSTGLGFNIGTGQLVLGGIQAIGNLWAAWEAQKLAREQFDFQKGVSNTNLTNSIQSYNTQLADRINARAFTEGRPEGYAQTYIEENKARDMR